jgi:SanA protein
MKKLKKLILIALIFFGICILFIWWANLKIENETKEFVTFDVTKLPSYKTAVVLGTNKNLANGNPNLYFSYRIKAAAELFKSGKIQNIIVSGDNSVKGYNEPEQMKNELIAEGIPAEKIYEDFAGFRTLDSVVRAKEIFGQNEIIFVSQKFHNERAVYLAQKKGIKAYGFNAKDVNKYFGFKTNAREKLARAKVFWDFLFGVDPKFGGEKILIP